MNILRKASLTLVILSGLTLAAHPVYAQATIDTGTGDIFGLHPFGTPDTSTYGQTFMTPDTTNVALEDFTFYANGPATDTFQGFVYAYDTSTNEITGSALYTSSVMAMTGSGNYDPITLNIGGLDLTPGQEYITFLSVTPVYATSSGSASFAAFDSSPYAGGEFVYQNNGSDFGRLSTTAFSIDQLGPGADVQFKADFSPVSVTATPEPSSMSAFAVAGLGLSGLLFRARKQRKQIS